MRLVEEFSILPSEIIFLFDLAFSSLKLLSQRVFYLTHFKLSLYIKNQKPKQKKSKNKKNDSLVSYICFIAQRGSLNINWMELNPRPKLIGRWSPNIFMMSCSMVACSSDVRVQCQQPYHFRRNILEYLSVTPHWPWCPMQEGSKEQGRWEIYKASITCSNRHRSP